MKKIILFFLAFLALQKVQAQDTIVKKSGDVILAKILELNPTNIKYKRKDMPDGPLYIENKSEIMMIKYANGLKEVFNDIVSSTPPVVAPANPQYYTPAPPVVKGIESWDNQYRYNGHHINEYELHDILSKSKDRKVLGFVQQSKNAKKLQLIGFAGIPLGIASVIYFGKSTGLFYNYNYGNTNYGSRNQLGLYRDEFNISLGFMACAIACPITAGIFKAKRTQYNREAISIYNEKY